MSRIAEPYTCDVCGVQKKESNHWFLARIDYSGRCARVIPWSAVGAAAAEVVHLCGSGCAQRWLGFALEKISQEESHEESHDEHQ